MTISEAEAHSRAVVAIQALLSKLLPGTPSHRIAERALDLAFNWPSLSCPVSEQALLAEADRLVHSQLRAKLLDEPLRPVRATESATEGTSVRSRYLAWRATLRPRSEDRLVHVEVWLTAEGRKGDGHAYLR